MIIVPTERLVTITRKAFHKIFNEDNSVSVKMFKFIHERSVLQLVMLTDVSVTSLQPGHLDLKDTN